MNSRTMGWMNFITMISIDEFLNYGLNGFQNYEFNEFYSNSFNRRDSKTMG